MEDSQKKEFAALLTKVMSGYGKPLPDKGMLLAWWEHLSMFPLPVVVRAMASYCDENGEFPPVPLGIAKRCKLMDGRPTDDEAWAIALTSLSEDDTVVWTSEIAEAFNLCRPVLDGGDEVGARMAFKDAYNRLVSAARLSNKPAKWDVSLGWDVRKREAALERAVVAGLLPAPTVQVLLPNYAGAGSVQEQGSPEGLKRVKEELAKLQDGWAKAAEKREAELKAEREAVQQRKADIAAQVAVLQEKRA